MTSGETARVWQDEVIPAGKWHEVAARYNLREEQIRTLGRRHIPQVIENKDFLLVTFVVPALKNHKFSEQWLHVYVDSQRAVTFHAEGLEIMDSLAERIDAHGSLGSSPSGVLAIVADVVTECFTPVVDHVDDAIESLEVVMMSRPSEDQLHELFQHKRLLADLRRVALPTISVLDGLQDGRYALIDPRSAQYLRDSYTYAWRVHELIDTMRDLLTSALDTYLSVVSNRLNDVMKRLTIVTTIFMPISFLAGVGGMNFTNIAFGSAPLMYTTLGLMVLLPVAMILYFRKKKWL